jgi:hypothetical protein
MSLSLARALLLLQLKQFHVAHTESFLAYMGQYVRTMINAAAAKCVSAYGPPPRCIARLTRPSDGVGWGGVGGRLKARGAPDEPAERREQLPRLFGGVLQAQRHAADRDRGTHPGLCLQPVQALGGDCRSCGNARERERERRRVTPRVYVCIRMWALFFVGGLCLCA